MAIDPWIARGSPGVDVTNTLAQIAELRQRDRGLDIGDRRNALLAQEDQQQQITAQQEQQMTEKWAEMEQYAEAPPEIKAQYVQSQAQKYPEFAQTPLAKMPPEQAFDAMRRGLAAKLGKTTEPKQLGALYKVDQGGRPVYAPADQAQGMSPWQEPDRPPAPREPPRPQLTDVTLPDGSRQKQWVVPGESSGTPVGDPNASEPDKPDRAAQQTEISLASKFAGDSKTFDTVAGQYRRILEVSRTPSAANDYALIYAFAKIQDPTSVVRESEFATAAKTGAYGETVKAAVTKVANGQTLTATQRADFLTAAQNAYKAQERQWLNSVAAPYHQQAKDYGLNWKNIWRDYRVKGSGESAEAKPKKTVKFGDL